MMKAILQSIKKEINILIIKIKIYKLILKEIIKSYLDNNKSEKLDLKLNNKTLIGAQLDMNKIQLKLYLDFDLLILKIKKYI